MASFSLNGKSLSKLKGSAMLKEIGMKELSPGVTKRALNDAGQVIINSTKVGYLDERSPDGSKWAKNPEWYKVMKGGAAILTGPTAKGIKGGKYSGYSFGNINTKRMKNALKKIVTTTKVTVQYQKDVEERAQINQLGGESKMILSGKGGDVELDINVQARPHLGVAENYTRLGGKTDPQHIEEIFGDMIVTIL